MALTLGCRSKTSARCGIVSEVFPSQLQSVRTARPHTTRRPQSLGPVALKKKFGFGVAIVAVINATPSDTSSPTEQVTYDTVLYFRGEDRINKDSSLSLAVVSEDDSSARSHTFYPCRFKATEYEPEDPHKSGFTLKGQINLPANFKPGVLLFKMTTQSPDEPLYLRTVTLQSQSGSPLEYLANSYIDSSHGERVVFPAKSFLPAGTPAGIKAFRKQDIAAHKDGPDKDGERKGADRIYGFDVYNDLGKPDDNKVRPTLGTAELPFPRRIRTGRPLDAKGYETRIPDSAARLPWVPIDERFTMIKQKLFEGLSAYAKGAVASSPDGFIKAALGLPSLQKKLAEAEFPDLAAVDAFYDHLVEAEGIQAPKPALRTATKADLLSGMLHRLDAVEDQLKTHATSLLAKLLDKKDPKKPALAPADEEGNLPEGEEKVLGIVEFLDGIIHRWPVPNVRKGAWHTDEDFGRQVMEGQDPLIVRVMTAEDLQTCATSDKDVEGLLEGASLSERIAEGKRIYLLDFHTHFVDFLDRVNNLPGARKADKRVFYAGRCILFSRSDKALAPVAIELETTGLPLTVYTPHHSPELWRLAKTVIASLETWHHQAISHLLQTHLCVEPYIIATRRCLSAMHPVNKLLQPHFRWTMRPNADARQNLIAADGIIETAFTIGSYSMQLIAQIYGKDWRFNTQSLPDDLVARGVAERDANGELTLNLPGYSYAEDGLLIYKALKNWVQGYVGLYYDDNTNGKRVTDDEELVAWWKCIRVEGHPDKEEGWVELKDIASLVNILTNICWTTSAHHGAVNYGQYQYSGYMPNRPSMIRKMIPLPGSAEEMELSKNFEGHLMQTISDPMSTATIMLMTKLLSHHSADEEFLNSTEHSWIKDPEALELHSKFVEELGAAERQMEERNQSRKVAYTQLMPSIDPSTLPPGSHPDPGYQVTYRGLPTSIAI